MKITCGTDIIEIDRIKESIETIGDKFKDKIYTKKEIEYCESKKAQKYQHYAARFAAKEAVFKAVSDNLENKFDLEWKNIEIVNNSKGRPEVKLDPSVGLEDLTIDISISHCKDYVVANTVCYTQ